MWVWPQLLLSQVTRSESHKKRLAIDYSQTINRFTLLDAYPLPRIDDTVNAIAQYQVFSTIDLRSAYHQVSINENDKPYTAFQAGNALYQFTRIPFGVTNGVACFQRIMANSITCENLNGTFAYLDNVTICGKDQQEYDENLKCMLSRCCYSSSNHLQWWQECFFYPKVGYSGGKEKSDQIHNAYANSQFQLIWKVLTEFLDFSSLDPALFWGNMTPHYYIRLPKSREAQKTFENLKKDVAESVICAIDEGIPFSVETDATGYASQPPLIRMDAQ